MHDYYFPKDGLSAKHAKHVGDSGPKVPACRGLDQVQYVTACFTLR
jgi:hypothetical protein